MPLGRGLDSLIPKKTIATKFSTDEINQIDEKNRILDIEVDKIQLNPHQPRQKFDHDELEDLINSIRVYGIIQPLIVTRIDNNNFQLIAGERRLRSAKILNLATVPVIVREAKEQEKLELALIENLQRKNLNPLEEAISFKRLLDEFNLTQETVAQKLGKKRSSVANTLRLLALPEEVQKAILDEKITEGHARAIAALESESDQKELLRKILQNQLTVRDVETQVKKVKFSGHDRARNIDPVMKEKEDKLRSILGHKIEIRKKARGGEISIIYDSQEDFNEIFQKLSVLE
jgi:ParB family transcriptional regulator, chromosome partitioning protein